MAFKVLGDGRKGRGNSTSSGSVSRYAKPPTTLQHHWEAQVISSPIQREQTEAQGEGFGGFHLLVSFRLCAQVGVCMCLGLSSGVRGVRQGRGGTDSRMVKGGQREWQSLPALSCLALSTRFLCSTPANPAHNSCLHTQVFCLSWWQ